MSASTRSWPSALVWLVPTGQAIRASLVGTLALGAAMTATATVLDVASATAPPWITAMILGGLATSAALALTDPAADLLAAVPTGRARRVVHRLLLAVPLTLIAVVAVALVSNLLAAGEDPAIPAMSVGALLALVSLAVAADAWSSRSTATAAASVPIFVVVVARVVPPETLAGDLVASWSTHPWAVVTVAISLAVAGHQR